MISESITIVTHDGAFHADDVIGVAVLNAIFNKGQNFGFASVSIVRTRDMKLVADADYVVDVGGVWDPEAGRFDHHQKGFAGARKMHGSNYASAGLVWAHHGKAFVSKIAPELTPEQVQAVVQHIDDELIAYVDQVDTGEAMPARGNFGLSMLIDAMNPTFAELKDCQATLAGTPSNTPEGRKLVTYHFQRMKFIEAVDMVTQMLLRQVIKAADAILGESKVRQAEKHADGQILVLPEPGLHWQKIVDNEMHDVLFVVYPEETHGTYMLQAVPVALGSFDSRKMLPAAWGGLRDKDLDEVTGTNGAVFCHTARFIAGAASLESIMQMAQRAVSEQSDS